jgi:glycosidase
MMRPVSPILPDRRFRDRHLHWPGVQVRRSSGLLLTLAITMSLATIAPLVRAEDRREWVDEIVYVVITEKFYDGDPHNDVMLRQFGKDRDKLGGGLWGGDLEGIIRKLDHLVDLGVTTLLIYPVMANDGGRFGRWLTTGYRPRDYFRVDENFGDIPTLRRLVDRAHGRGLKVMLDLPLALPGTEHPFYNDPAKRGWFGAESQYGVRQWDATNPEVADYLISIARFWRETSGCDGFRLDSAHRLARSFWKRFAREVKGADGDRFTLLGEVVENPRLIGPFLTETGFDAAYDFSFYNIRDVIGRDGHMGKISFFVGEAKQFYPDPRRMAAQIDDYETSPFVAAALEPKLARFKLAMTALLTFDRVPLLYPGDEVGLAYHEVGALFEEVEKDPPIFRDVKGFIALRRREEVLRRGAFVEVRSDDPIYAFLRVLGERRILVVLNRSGEPRKVAFPLGETPWAAAALEDARTGKAVKKKGVSEPVELGPFGALVAVVS